MKSTFGCAMFLVGPNTYFPLMLSARNRQLEQTRPLKLKSSQPIMPYVQKAFQVKTFQKTNPQGEVLLHASLPCVGGSPCVNTNSLTDVGAERVEQQQKEFTRSLSKKSMDHTFQLLLSCQRTASPGSGRWSNRPSKDISSSYFRFIVASLGWMIATNMNELFGIS